MGNQPLQLALREMQGHLTNPRVLGAVAVVGALLGIAGPFGTITTLTFWPRLVYWLAVAAMTYGFGYAVTRLAIHLLGVKVSAPWLRVIVFGLITGVPVTLVVLAINAIAFGPNWQEAIDPLTLWFNATLGSMGVVTVSQIIGTTVEKARAEAAPTGAVETPKAPAILERLPLPQRGRLWALVVADHYVEVWTERGNTLLLLRLSDAIKEAEGEPGLQIHRSHWVALGAVRRTLKADGKSLVELPDGRRLPVSRGYLEAARAAGIA